MRLPDDIRDAIKSGADIDLCAELVKLMQSGVTRDEIFKSLESFRAELRDAADEPSEDRTMELMDLFEGWCAPHLRL